MDNSSKQNAKFLGEFEEDYWKSNEPWELIPARSKAETGIAPNGIPDSIKIPGEDGIWPVGFYARRIVACVNFCAGHETSFLQNTTLLDLAKQRRTTKINPFDAMPTFKVIEKDALIDALKKLTFMARTSGGTSGLDKGLMDACETAERILVLAHESPSFFMATETGIADIDIHPTDN